MLQKYPGFVLLSPWLIIGAVHLIAKWSTETLSPETVVFLTVIAYWGLTGLMKLIFTDKADFSAWFRKPLYKPKWLWLVLAIALGVFPMLGILVPNFNLLTDHPFLTMGLILFALVNPCFEEGYWRGLLLDAGGRFPKWAIVAYSSILFVLSHPLMWGVFSIANRSIQLYGALLLMGVVWSVLRYKTGSLRWSVYSHMLVDLGNLSVFVFLNLYIPPGMG